MRSRWRIVRRVIGVLAVALTLLNVGTCGMTDSTGLHYEASTFSLDFVVDAIELQFRHDPNPTGWSRIDNISSKYNGLAYWTCRFEPGGVVVPQYYVGVITFVASAALLLPEFWLLRRALRNGDVPMCPRRG